MKFIHLRSGTKGGYTIAYEKVDSPEQYDSLYRWSYAQCSNKDNYCKKIGRDIAMGRIMAGQSKYFILPNSLPKNSIVTELINELYKYHI